jgi:cell division protease FtsH
VPRDRAALGYTLHLPTDDHFLMSRFALMDKLKAILDARASEEAVYGEVSAGAENDLERATALARQMVCMFGMSDQVGLMYCAQQQNPISLAAPEGPFQRDCCEETAREIDAGVKNLLDQAYKAAKRILTEHRDQQQRVAHEVLKKETLDAVAFNLLIGRLPPGQAAAIASERQERRKLGFKRARKKRVGRRPVNRGRTTDAEILKRGSLRVMHRLPPRSG